MVNKKYGRSGWFPMHQLQFSLSLLKAALRLCAPARNFSVYALCLFDTLPKKIHPPSQDLVAVARYLIPCGASGRERTGIKSSGCTRAVGPSLLSE